MRLVGRRGGRRRRVDEWERGRGKYDGWMGGVPINLNWIVSPTEMIGMNRHLVRVIFSFGCTHMCTEIYLIDCTAK